MRTHIVDETRTGKTIGLSERILLILLVSCIQMLYVPTSSQLTGGIEPKLSIDVFPVLPIWVIPYVLCYPLWLAGILWATFKMDARLFRSFIGAFFLACLSAVSIFVFFPTYVPQASFSGTDIFTNLLQFVHENWGRYDAFPSGHVYITTILALFYNHWYPRFRRVWVIIPVIVAFSTLFTGQHYLVDVIGGLLVAFLAHHFGCLWAGNSSEVKNSASK
jgi:membrane-associated phospholipid phosphatase